MRRWPLLLLGLTACSVKSGDPGEAGASVEVSSLSAGDSQCPEGGASLGTQGARSFVCNGARGPQGAAGAPGPPGPPGSPGPSGLLQQQLRGWSSNTFVSGELTIPGSEIEADFVGGRSLLVFANIHVIGVRGTFVCRPYVGTLWLGQYDQANMTLEAEIDVVGQTIWPLSRLYRNSPFGRRTLSIRCTYAAFTGGAAAVCGRPCTWGFIELDS